MNVDILEQNCVYDGFLKIQQTKMSIDSYDGRSMIIRREIMDRGDAVVVVLYDPQQKKLVMIEQFFAGCAINNREDAWHIGLVSGGMKPEESPIDVAVRETQEEAGIQVFNLELLYSYYPSPGGSSEKIYLYYGEVDASQAPKIGGCPDEQEDIRILQVSIPEAIQLVKQGKIKGASTIIALQHLLLINK